MLPRNANASASVAHHEMGCGGCIIFRHHGREAADERVCEHNGDALDVLIPLARICVGPGGTDLHQFVPKT